MMSSRSYIETLILDPDGVPLFEVLYKPFAKIMSNWTSPSSYKGPSEDMSNFGLLN